jgi:hypothetical protein
MAATDLRELLASAPHPAGEYVLRVIDLDDDGDETDTVWATVKVWHDVVLTSPAARR